MNNYKDFHPLKKLRIELWARHYFERYHIGAHRIRKRTKEQPKYDVGDTDDFIPISAAKSRKEIV